MKVGDKVTKGQVIGRLGNSGNTSEPHLHFQLTRSAAPLVGDNLPYEFDSFNYVGVFKDTGELDTSGAGPRTNQLPLANSITDYPKPRHARSEVGESAPRSLLGRTETVRKTDAHGRRRTARNCSKSRCGSGRR